MKKTLYAIMGLALLTLVPTIGHADACKLNAGEEAKLINIFTLPLMFCEDLAHPGLRSIEIQAGDFKLTAPLDVPDHTRIYGVAPLPADPYNPASKLRIDAIVKGYGIRLGNYSELSGLDIQYPKSDPATPLLAIVNVTGNFNQVKNNKILGSAYVGVLLGGYAPLSVASYNIIGANNIVADQGTGLVVMGLRNTIILNGINVLSDKTFAGKNGMAFLDWPQLLVSSNILLAGTDGKALTFSNSFIGQPMPIGAAANLIGSNISLSADKTKYIPLTSADTNFDDYFKKPITSLPTCAGKDKAPYTDDGACKQPVEAKVCPPSQVVLAGGDCGCVEGTALDAQLNVCVKTVEKTVDKVVEKIVEKEVIVEKPTDISKDNKIVASPASNSSGCSLVPGQAASALTPVAVFLMTIGMTGLAAYRSSSKTPRAKGKKG